MIQFNFETHHRVQGTGPTIKVLIVIISPVLSHRFSGGPGRYPQTHAWVSGARASLLPHRKAQCSAYSLAPKEFLFSQRGTIIRRVWEEITFWGRLTHQILLCVDVRLSYFSCPRQWLCQLSLPCTSDNTGPDLCR